MSTNWKRWVLLLALVPIAFAADAKKPKKSKVPENVGPTVVAPQNVFLRNSFDVDPSSYIGQFVAPGTLSVDESSAMPLTCSKFISYKKIGGGGVMYDEFFNASTEAAVRVGVPLVANVSATANAASTVRVKYTLTEKMVADIQDPAGFETCCKQAPDQCTDRYIGEFLSGSGEVYFAKSSGQGAKGKASPGTVGVNASFKNGVEWERSVEFPQPVYFAFKTKENRWKPDGAVAGCGDWINGAPKSSQGKYFVGISQPTKTEADSRSLALTSGREQVVKYIAESITTGTLNVTEIGGASDDLTSKVNDRSFVEGASSGVAKLVKDEAWCVSPNPTPGGDVYVAKVLMFLPKSQEQAAATAVSAVAKPDATTPSKNPTPKTPK